MFFFGFWISVLILTDFLHRFIFPLIFYHTFVFLVRESNCSIAAFLNSHDFIILLLKTINLTVSSCFVFPFYMLVFIDRLFILVNYSSLHKKGFLMFSYFQSFVGVSRDHFQTSKNIVMTVVECVWVFNLTYPQLINMSKPTTDHSQFLIYSCPTSDANLSITKWKVLCQIPLELIRNKVNVVAACSDCISQTTTD